jgi:hypothetical protein
MPPLVRQDSKKPGASSGILEERFQPSMAHLKNPTGLLMEACRAGSPLFYLGETAVRYDS